MAELMIAAGWKGDDELDVCKGKAINEGGDGRCLRRLRGNRERGTANDEQRGFLIYTLQENFDVTPSVMG